MLETILLVYTIYTILGFATFLHWYLTNRKDFENYLVEVHTLSEYPTLSIIVDMLTWPLYWIIR